ncbi:MAG: DUF4105 domain-containing protein [Candidatus Symbiothrix sp.]|jgi:hypothetical protein|nr:DUF4105 domain-containing protein [Candidatus Symbiothrix sp.]
MKSLFIFFCLLASLNVVYAADTDSLQVSLLTVMPRSNEVYTYFGHTALRLYDPSTDLDEVYNWGTFDFDTPNFIYRFVKGETDYFLSHTKYARFLWLYAQGNSMIVEQVLNLHADEKARLTAQLKHNLQPENLVYRYNFFFDNCTTRPRDMIENSLSQRLQYCESSQITFRKRIHDCTKSSPWLTFGIDLLIGSGADSIIGGRSESFLPTRLMCALERSGVVQSQQTVLQSSPVVVPQTHFWDSPMSIGVILALFYLSLALTRGKKRRIFRFCAAFLFLIAGVGGCIVAFVTFISYHPCTCPNWNLVWLHPLHFIAFITCLTAKPRRWMRLYHSLNIFLLIALLASWYFLPQALNPAIIPYIICLIAASGGEMKSNSD